MKNLLTAILKELREIEKELKRQNVKVNTVSVLCVEDKFIGDCIEPQNIKGISK